MATPKVQWAGSDQESRDLLNAVAANCQCEFDEKTNARTKTCAPHEMMSSDQSALNGLLFMRRARESLISGEGIDAP